MAELADLEQRFTGWAARLDAGRIDEEQFDQHNQRLLVRKQGLRKTLAEIDGRVGEAEAIRYTLAEVSRVLVDFPQVWQASTQDERREMLRLMVEDLRVHPQHAELKLVLLDPVRLELPRGRRVQAAAATAD